MGVPNSCGTRASCSTPRTGIMRCITVAAAVDDDTVLDEEVQLRVLRLPLLHRNGKKLLLLVGRLLCELPLHRLQSWDLLVLPQVVIPLIRNHVLEIHDSAIARDDDARHEEGGHASRH